ncbi:L,D-transpeptidase [uncultured Aureimonas sp.]|uniref:L,D-transpeptidase family protein n=1 Tax=uncultured Aureimonas sp. TaxID=1604662 RepID=UPI0025F8DFC2|nr:L,D-transpeptidase [uncultured Aureimonas sp.]
MPKPSWITLALVLAMGESALAAPPMPDLSEGAINGATFEDWTARQQAADAAAENPADQPSDGDDAGPVEDGDEPAPPAGSETAKPTAEPPAEAEAEPEDAPDPFMIRVQVLLDRAHASPGVIDGRSGGNTEKAIRAYEEAHDMSVDGVVDEALWKALSVDGGAAVKTYQLTREDIDQRYISEIPSDYGAMAKLDCLCYRGPSEMLAERFHMDEKLLLALNPGADFKSTDTKLIVADPGAPPEGKVNHIVVDKSKGELFAFDADNRVLMSAPATIGSEDTPSPSGTMKVNGSAPNPTYEYDPDKNFQQGKNRKKLTIPAGPNGPVGAMWIDLSKPTYGIHGAPEPSQIGKTGSHGCVRLTNWDAEALAKLVQPAKTTVEFKG